MKNTIFVCENGWIIIGIRDKSVEREGYSILSSAFVVRSWSNGKGIGGLTDEENKDEYTLDEIGAVQINNEKVLFEIPCGW